MQVKELADLAGTTVRTVRHYHRLGLIPIPAERGGRRDYDLSHVARLIRVRWLAEAGVPLARIAGMLDTGPADRSAETDLSATVEAIDARVAELAAQRARVVRLVAAAAHGDALSPMPGVVGRFYDHLEEQTAEDEVRRAIRSERDFVELAYYRGDMPPEAEIVYRGLTDAQFADSLAGFRSLAGRDAREIDVEQAAADTVRQALQRFGPELPRLAASVDPELVRRAANLYVRISGDDRLAAAIADAFVAAIEQVRRS